MKETKLVQVTGNEIRSLEVRRKFILESLYWLRKYHTGYKDISINESNHETTKP